MEMCTDIILIDLQKTFDKLEHKIPFKNMTYFGFRTSVIKWFQSYVSSKKFLSVNDIFFEPGILNCNVLLGSILGLLLLLIYMNHLS